jgi:hypothetical protein
MPVKLCSNYDHQSQPVRQAPGIRPVQRSEVGQYPKPLNIELSLYLQV